MGNLATRPEVRRNHPPAQRCHGPSPTPPSKQAGRHRRRFCGFVGKSSTHRNRRRSEMANLANRGDSHSHPPDIALLVGFKDDQGGDGRAPRAGCQERGQEKVEVHLRLVHGRIRGSGRSPPGWSTRPYAGQHIGRSVCSFPRRRGRGGLGHGAPTAFVGNFILPAFLSSKLRLHRRDLMLSRLF